MKIAKAAALWAALILTTAQALPPPPVARISALVEANYLQPLKPSGQTVEEVMSLLDPHSRYISPEAFDEMRSGTPSGSLALVLVSTSAGPTVALITDQGARDAGLRVGDIVSGVDGKSTSGRGVHSITQDFSGEAGTQVRLTIRRRDATSEMTLPRVAYHKGPGVTARRLGDAGYIRIERFGEDTSKAVSEAVANLNENPLEGLILDLRDNAGGLLQAPVAIADLFLDGGAVGEQRGARPEDVERYNARRGDVSSGLPMVVLVNARTMSGAEILAGALQDRRRAKVLGMQSFGSGTIQTVIPLGGANQGALALTTGAWFLPSGRPLQKIGLTPDVLVANGAQDLLPQPREADAPGAIDAPTALPVARASLPATPPEMPPAGYDPAGDYQLERAVRMIER